MFIYVFIGLFCFAFLFLYKLCFSLLEMKNKCHRNHVKVFVLLRALTPDVFIAANAGPAAADHHAAERDGQAAL